MLRSSYIEKMCLKTTFKQMEYVNWANVKEFKTWIFYGFKHEYVINNIYN